MRTLFAIGGVFAFIFLIVGIVVSANNGAASAEEQIIAAHDDSRNVLSQYAPKISDALGVTSIQTDALQKLFESSNESRYGEDGSTANVQFIREQNPNLDQSNYGKIIQMIEAGRNDFQAAQKVKIDKVRAYRTSLRTFPGGAIKGMLGYPKPTDDGTPFFKAYGEIVVSGHADNAFKTGIDNGLGIGVQPTPTPTAAAQ